MNTSFSRSDQSRFAKWWWTVDRLALASLLLIVAFGIMMIFAASPAVAERIGLDAYHFVVKQFLYLLPSLALMIAISFLPPRMIQKIALIGLGFAMAALVLTLFIGVEIKGARRWISLGPLSLQPSEFVKPTFAVVSGLFIALGYEHADFRGKLWATLLFLVCIVLLLLQPDIGMAVVLSAIWFVQIFLSGLPFIWVIALICLGVMGISAAYFLFPHAAARIDKFLDPTQAGYQVEKSLEAFMRGGVFGRGPGEGRVKEFLPDAHADFIFAVAGEEFGFITCIIIIFLFAVVIFRMIQRLRHETNFFVLLAGSGLVVQFAIQAIINMASTLHLIPTKGMTLPFISYGGSSLIALALALGMLFGLTRRRGNTGEGFIESLSEQDIRHVMKR